MLPGVGSRPGSEATQVVNSPMVNAGASGPGGMLSQQKDASEAATAPKFGDIYKQIEAKYGAKPEKPREIKKTLGKDDFLKIMITQMKHQDPTNPFKAEQMATEIAQFTSVEQLTNLNKGLEKMAEANKPLERLAMTNMIGKTVIVDRDRFPHQEGSKEALNFNLPKNAKEVKVAIVAETGETVFEKDIGSSKAGEVEFSWDGKKTNTLPAKSGNYALRVQAVDDKGVAIDTNPQGKARVIGVSFEGSDPVFLVGDAKHQEKVLMKSIVRVESDAGPAVVPGAQMLGGPPAQAMSQMLPPQLQQAMGQGQQPQQGSSSAIQPMETPALPRNFIAFDKGKGSANLSNPEADPAVAAAIQKFQQQQADQLRESQAAPQDRGFPSGLSDPEQQARQINEQLKSAAPVNPNAPGAAEKSAAAPEINGWKRPEIQLDAKKQFTMEKGGEVK